MMQSLKIIPLGGFGEIGKNCTALEYGDDILVIDAGLMFPEDDMLGVDLVIPDWSYLVEHRDQIRGVMLTHGHEDHIGALPYLLKQISAPLYATSLTRGLVEEKLRHQGLSGQAINTIRPGEEIEFPSFRVTPFHVNHSIPDSVGLAIRTPLGLVVHTGDFKIDHTPLGDKSMDLSVLGRLANEGVMVLLSDSTNAESPGYTASESELVDTFQRVFSRAEGRIIVATFASLISRIQLVAKTAAQFGRKIAIAGRSMEESVAIAEKLGYVDIPDHLRIPLSQINDLPDREVCVLATGSQGEPNAVLARMATGRFRQISIRRGDTVVYSSKAIPGNETQIHRNIDNLFRQGAQVVYGERAGLHVSGHAAQEELKLMLNILRPLYFVPMHGAYRMLKQHAQLAYDLGFSAQDVFVLDDGMPLELDHSGARVGERMEMQTIFVDGSLVGDVGTSLLRDRMALSQDGFVIARVSIEAQTGHVTEKPEIISQGFVYVPESLALMQQAELAILETIERVGHPAGDLEEMERHIKRRLESLFYGETRRRPIVIPMVDTL